MGQLCLVVPSLTLMHVKVRLKEAIKRLHAEEHLHGVEMSSVLEGHGRETNAIVVTNTLVEEETLDAYGDAVKGNLGGGWSDNIKLPVGVNEVKTSI